LTFPTNETGIDTNELQNILRQRETTLTMKRIVTILALSIATITTFILPLFSIDFRLYLMLSAILCGLCVLIFISDKKTFPAILFFTITLLTRPLNQKFTDWIHMEFPGTYFLVPIVIFTLLILTVPSIRKNIGWWKRDTIDRNSWLIIIGLSLISGLSLFIWGKYVAEDLSKFVDILPDVPLVWILINGIGFALFNSIAEEYLSRGMLCDGLEKIITDRKLIIAIQALVFSIFHYHGFPGGLSGIAMVFAWSVVLGIIRYRTKGLIGVLTAHFFADLSIYFILYGLK